MSFELLYRVESALSMLGYIILLVLFIYILLRVRKPSPSVALAMATAKVVVSQKFRSIVLLVFLGFFELHMAFFVQYFVGNLPLSKLLEMSGLFVFLFAESLWIWETFKGKAKASVEK